MVPGIDPKVDYIFKRLFGREQNRALLIHLLNSALKPARGRDVSDILLLNPFNEKETFGDKLSVVDIKARDTSGRQFNVEMQMFAVRFFPKRVLYYWSRLHQEQLREGEDYPSLRPTISISFVNGTLFPALPDYHLLFRLLDGQHGATFTDDLEVHLIELPKFTKDVNQITDPFDAWLYFLRFAEVLDTDTLPGTLGLPPFRDAMEELRMVTQNDLERERYEARLKVHRDALSLVRELSASQEEAKEALVKGKMIGEKIGVIHLCQRRLNRPLTPPDQLTALPPDELARLADQLEKELFGPPPASSEEGRS